MKILIFNNPPPDRIDHDHERFSSMASILGRIGLSAEYRRVGTIMELENQLMQFKPDLVYSADYFLPDHRGEQLSTHEFLEDAKVPFIGSDASSLARVLSKSETKDTWKFYDIATPNFCQVLTTLGAGRALDGFLRASNFPYLLKPDKEGNSRGLEESNIIFNKKDLLEKIDELLKNYDSILVEEYLGDQSDLREFTVAMIGSKDHRLLMPAEISLKEKKPHRLITTEDKDQHHTLASAVSDARLRDRLCSFAEQAFTATGMVDYSRCDILMTGDKLYAIEINGLPMIPDKWFEVCAAGIGLNEEQYIVAIFLASICRHLLSGNESFILTAGMMRSLPPAAWHTFCEGGCEKSREPLPSISNKPEVK